MKKITGFFLLLCFFFLLRIVPIFWHDYPQYFPEWYNQYRLKQLINDNNHLIDEILAICERSKTEGSPVYCLDALAEYSVWFEKYKHLIKEKSELKELVITKLKEALRNIGSESDFFNSYLKKLE